MRFAPKEFRGDRNIPALPAVLRYAACAAGGCNSLLLRDDYQGALEDCNEAIKLNPKETQDDDIRAEVEDALKGKNTSAGSEVASRDVCS